MAATASSKKERRGKKQQPQASSERAMSTLQEQLGRAQAAIAKSQVGITVLHQQWKTHLLRLSYLVFVVTVHQAYGPMTACLQATQNEPSIVLTTFHPWVLIVEDSIVYVMGIVLSVLEIFFLRASTDYTLSTSFSSRLFLLANSLMPIMVALRYMTSLQTTTNDNCLERSWFLQALPLNSKMNSNNVLGDDTVPHRGYPVVIVFHCIVTACFWFMSSQARQQEHNRQAVDKLQRELRESQQQQSDKKSK